MGSGVSKQYTGTLPKSQPYARSYEVTKDMLEIDKRDPDIYSPIHGYFKNPTATDITKSIVSDGIYVNGKRAHGTMAYVMDKSGNIVVGARFNPNNPSKRSPHPSLIGGKNPRVQSAGMITFSKGKIVSIDNHSGHFKPNIKSMKKVDKFMERLYKTNPNVFNSKSKWRKK